VAFILIGSLSVIVSGLVGWLLVEPPAPQDDSAEPAKKGFAVVLEEILMLVRFFRIPSFGVMIMQGIFGTIPWGVLGLMTYFFQLSGLSDGEATILQTEGLVVGTFGNMLGGYVADALARRFGYHGRPLNAQITVAIGLPIIVTMCYWIEPGQGNVYIYFSLLFAWSLLGCWAQSGTNFPILCEIVPAEKRCRILAWECCLENTIASLITPIVVTTVSLHFGYNYDQSNSDDPVAKLESAVALGKSMTLITIVPGICCFCVYSILHLTYQRDVERMQRMTKEKVLGEDKASENHIGSAMHDEKTGGCPEERDVVQEI